MDKEQGGGPTIREIAAELNVSPSTVSRAFNRPDVLRPETIRRVRATAERMGYVPNHAARVLSTGRQGNLAVVVPDIANPFFPPLIRATQATADAADFSILLGDSDETPEREDVLIAKLGVQVAGFVLAASRLSAERIYKHAQVWPVVLINRDVPKVARVLIDTERGVGEAIDHLAELGHRRIAYLAGPTGSWSNQERQRAARRAADQRRMALTVIAAREPTYEAGRRAAVRVLSSDVTAALAFDDLVAQGLLAGLAEQGVAVPRDFSVIGCDDVLASMTYPPLTTISSRPAEAGRKAVELLLGSISAKRSQDVRYVLDTHLVIRGTTAPARE